MHRVHAVAVACVLTATATACGSQPSVTQPHVAQPSAVSTGDAGAGRVRDQWTSCETELGGTPPMEAGHDAPTLPLLDPAFVPVSAIVCGVDWLIRRDGGTDLVATEEHAIDVAALEAVLRLPVLTPPAGNYACRLDLPSVGWLAVVDASGRWVRPGAPTDECGRIRDEVTEVVRALVLTRVSTRVLREVTSAAAARAGCSQEWADMVWVETTQGGTPSALTGDPFPGAARVRLCVYEVPVQEQGSDKPGGMFSRGGLLEAGVRARVTRLLLDSAPAVDCARQATRFALLLPADGPGDVYVELDGCQRILTESANAGLEPGTRLLSQASGELVNLLSEG